MRSSADNAAHRSPLRRMREHPITAPPPPIITYRDDGVCDYAINLSLMNDISAPKTILYDNYRPTSILGKLKHLQQGSDHPNMQESISETVSLCSFDVGVYVTFDKESFWHHCFLPMATLPHCCGAAGGRSEGWEEPSGKISESNVFWDPGDFHLHCLSPFGIVRKKDKLQIGEVVRDCQMCPT